MKAGSIKSARIARGFEVEDISDRVDIRGSRYGRKIKIGEEFTERDGRYLKVRILPRPGAGAPPFVPIITEIKL